MPDSLKEIISIILLSQEELEGIPGREVSGVDVALVIADLLEGVPAAVAEALLLPPAWEIAVGLWSVTVGCLEVGSPLQIVPGVALDHSSHGGIRDER